MRAAAAFCAHHPSRCLLPDLSSPSAAGQREEEAEAEASSSAVIDEGSGEVSEYRLGALKERSKRVAAVRNIGRKISMIPRALQAMTNGSSVWKEATTNSSQGQSIIPSSHHYHSMFPFHAIRIFLSSLYILLLPLCFGWRCFDHVASVFSLFWT